MKNNFKLETFDIVMSPSHDFTNKKPYWLRRLIDKVYVMRLKRKVKKEKSN